MKSNFSEEIKTMTKNLSFNYSAIIKSESVQEIEYSYQENLKIKSASLIKLFIMAYIFDQVFHKKINLCDSINTTDESVVEGGIYPLLSDDKKSLIDLVVLMITISDNTATNALIHFFGLNEINNYIKKNGYDNTRLNRKMMDFEAIEIGLDNFTSAIDIYKLLKKVFNRQVFNNALCHLFYEILRKQQDKRMAGYLLNDSVNFAHKTGDLERINHDVGLFMDHQTFIILLTWDSDNFVDARQWISMITATIYKKIRGVNDDY